MNHEKSLQETFAPNGICFGCGVRNEKGLRIKSYPEGEEVVCEWRAEAHHQAILPHSVPNGPIATAAHVHMGISAPTWDAQEYRPLKEPHLSMVDAVFPVKNGFFELPEKPGLGMVLNDAAIKSMGSPARPTDVPHRMDGSIAFR